MKQQTANWQRQRQGARDTLIAHTRAKLRRHPGGRPPAARYPQRVLRVIARFKAHTIAPPLSRRALLTALRDFRVSVEAKKMQASKVARELRSNVVLATEPYIEILDDLDDLLFRLEPKAKAPRR